jgi:hypothetical protein
MIPRCWFLRRSVKDDVVLVGLDYMFESVTLLGSSCGITLDVGVPSERPFKIFPNGNGSDLVLVRLAHMGDIELGLIHITRETDGKMIVSHDPLKGHEHACLDVDYQLYPGGIQVRSKGIRFTSDPSARWTRKDPVKLAHPATVLNFITGRISHEDLVEAARKVKRRDLIKTTPHFITTEVVSDSSTKVIEKALGLFDGLVNLVNVDVHGDRVFARFTLEAANRFFFWREVEEAEPPKEHPHMQGASLLGTIRRNGSFNGNISLVKRILGVSKVRVGGEQDEWRACIDETNNYARGVSMTLVLDANVLQSEQGQAELVQFLKAALLLKDAEYIALSKRAFPKVKSAAASE